jgi:hypothetical protein
MFTIFAVSICHLFALTFPAQPGNFSEGGQRSFAALLPFLAFVLSKLALLLPFASGSYFGDQPHCMLEIQILSVESQSRALTSHSSAIILT